MNMSKIPKLRPATPEDAELVYDIKYEAYAEHSIRGYGSWDEEIQRRVTRGNLPFTRLISVGSEVVGWIAADPGGFGVEIMDVHIRPTHQGRGYGSRVIRKIIKASAAAGKDVTLQVLKVNPSRVLYERLGFVATGTTPTHVIMRRLARPARPT